MAEAKFVEWEKRYTGWVAIEVTPNKVINLLLRDENNLLHVNGDNELYCDLQIANWVEPTDDFEVWVTTGIVNQVDWWPQSWLLLHYEEAWWAYAQWLKGNDGKIYYDPGTWTFKLVYYAQDVDDLFTQLRSEISAVWYSWEYDDLLNRPWIVHISYSQEQSEWIIEWTMKDNCMCMITPYNWEVPATITVDWTAYTVLGNDWVTRKIYGDEPLVWIFQPDTENQVNYISTFLRKLDTALSDSSENAVQNKVVKAGLDLKANIADLATVATTWDYDDLINKPTIGDASLIIKKNWVVVDTFTANATQNVTADITVPTKLSDLTDDSDFVKDYELASVAYTWDYANLINKPTIWDATFIVQKNWVEVGRTTANATSASVANVIVPVAEDNLVSSSTTNPLSANQGRVLNARIQNLEARWRFLSLWSASTWLPQTNPVEDPYQYHTWDYYIVYNVWTGTNYRPNGSVYTAWVASTTVETAATLGDWDTYIYDGNNWIYQVNTQRSVAFVNVAWDAMDNISLAWYLNAKQDTIVAWNNITIDSDWVTINAVDTTYWDATSTTAWLVKLGDDTPQTIAANNVSATQFRTYAVQNDVNWKMVVNVPWTDTQTQISTATTSNSGTVKLGSDTLQTTAPENVSSKANRTYALQLNSSGQAMVNVPWTDTTYTAWTNVTIDPNDNNKISVNIPAYSSATSSVAWVVKLWSDTVQTEWANTPSSTTGKSYAVQVNSAWQMVVNVPWTDNNTTYTEWTWIDISNQNVISVDPNDLDGNWLTVSSGQLAIDTSVVATQTDLSSKANASDLNTKTFFITWYTGQTNLDTATAAYEYFNAGKMPILSYLNQTFNLYAWNSTTWILQFTRSYITNSVAYQHTIKITIVSDEATTIDSETINISMISTQANNILTNGAKLRAWTESNYQALTTKDNNTIYLTV